MWGGGGGGGIGGVTLSLRRLCRSPCCGHERYASVAGDSGRPFGCLRNTLRSTCAATRHIVMLAHNVALEQNTMHACLGLLTVFAL